MRTIVSRNLEDGVSNVIFFDSIALAGGRVKEKLTIVAVNAAISATSAGDNNVKEEGGRNVQIKKIVMRQSRGNRHETDL